MSSNRRSKVKTRKFGPVLSKMRRYFFLEVGLTPKLQVSKKEIIEIYLEYTGNGDVNHSKIRFIQKQYDKCLAPVFNTRAIRDKRDKSVKYSNYMRSSQWRRLRIDVYNHYNGICDKCSADLAGKRFDIHHKNYDNLFNEEMEDLQLLCPGCHSRAHQRKKR